MPVLDLALLERLGRQLARGIVGRARRRRCEAEAEGDVGRVEEERERLERAGEGRRRGCVGEVGEQGEQCRGRQGRGHGCCRWEGVWWASRDGGGSLAAGGQAGGRASAIDAELPARQPDRPSPAGLRRSARRRRPRLLDKDPDLIKLRRVGLPSLLATATPPPASAPSHLCHPGHARSVAARGRRRRLCQPAARSRPRLGPPARSPYAADSLGRAARARRPGVRVRALLGRFLPCPGG